MANVCKSRRKASYLYHTSVFIITTYFLTLAKGQQCDVNVNHRTRGIIESPRYPLNYPSNAKCRWRITIPVGYQQITFYIVKFNVENIHSSKHCITDYLEISQIVNGKREIQGRYCGHKRSMFKTVAYGRYVKLKFHSNGYATSSGFRIYWYANLGCGHKQKGSEGIIASPNHPSNYPNNIFCKWKVETSESTAAGIKLNMRSFHLQRNYPLCRKDYLSIRATNGTEIYKLCGDNVPSELTIMDRQIIIVFRTNKRKSYSGFNIHWEAIKMPDIQCGMSGQKPSSRQRRIVGGFTQHPSAFPWMVQITTILSGYGRFRAVINCGGALIADRWILTAAHCLKSKKPIKSIKAYLGGFKNRDENSQIMEIYKTFTHPEYLGGLRHDLALMELKTRINYSDKLRRICLPQKPSVNNIAEDEDFSIESRSAFPKKCWVAGWGKTESNRNADELMSIEMNNHGQCSLKEFICAKRINETNLIGPCGGDSGGPLMCENSHGYYTVEGVLSHGPRKCGSGYDFFTSVNHYNNWILRTMRSRDNYIKYS